MRRARDHNSRMPNHRTSETHPLEIAYVQASPDHGRIGLTFCPGKCQPDAATGSWDRDLDIDLDAVKNWGASLLLTLVEQNELEQLRVPGLGEAARIRNIQWLHLPIKDYHTPDNSFENDWASNGGTIRQLLRNGSDIVVHCKGGLGRAGMIAARLLVELGVPPETAIKSVRAVREGAIETASQEEVVRQTKPMP